MSFPDPNVPCEVTISGRSFSAAVEGSGVPAEESWPQPTYLRRGAGGSYRYSCASWFEGRRIYWQLLDVYEILEGASSGDADAARDRQALRRDIDRLAPIYGVRR